MHMRPQTPDFLGYIANGTAHRPEIRDQLLTHVRRSETTPAEIDDLTTALLDDLAARSRQRHEDHQQEKLSLVPFNTIRGAVLNLTAIATEPEVLCRMPGHFAAGVAVRMARNARFTECRDGGSLHFAIGRITAAQPAYCTPALRP